MKKQEQQELQNEYLGTEKNGVYRPDIVLENLDTSKIDKSKISNGFCDCVMIPMITTKDESLVYEQVFCYLVDKVASNFNDVENQPHGLFLVIDDNDVERKYYIGANVQIEDWGGISTEQSIEEIHPVIQEQAIVELALLKATNPEQFLLKYTRYQVAQRPEILNRFGFFGDCILNDGSYRSEWIHEECVDGKKWYTYLNVCVENVKNENSQIQFLPVGISDKISA